MKIELRKTCSACPEQYEAYLGDKQVGYLRLRHGYFTVEFPDVHGKLIYSAEPKGDGMFHEDEREYYLYKAKEKILRELHNGNP